MDGNASVGKDLTVSGAASFNTASVVNDFTVGGATHLKGNVTMDSSASVAKDLAVGGDITANGNISAKNLYAADDIYVGGKSLSSQFNSLTGQYSSLNNRVNKVGAGAAALAALHPGEYDPTNKLDFAAGYGHYSGANAAALGMYYHPNEDTTISVSGTMGNGENMVNAGVSFKIGPTGAKTMSRTALTKQIAQDQQVIKAMANKMAQMEQQMNRVLALVDVSKVKEMPDVPQGHWAKDAVDHLAGNGIVKGYTDGKFHGDKPMTRYEYAQMLYTALKQGKIVDQGQLNEYAPELAQLKAAEKNK